MSSPGPVAIGICTAWPNSRAPRAPFRQVDDPDVILENYVDDTHGFMRVEIEDDVITARYIAVPRPYEPPATPPRVADLFQLQFKANKLVR